MDVFEELEQYANKMRGFGVVTRRECSGTNLGYIELDTQPITLLASAGVTTTLRFGANKIDVRGNSEDVFVELLYATGGDSRTAMKYQPHLLLLLELHITKIKNSLIDHQINMANFSNAMNAVDKVHGK